MQVVRKLSWTERSSIGVGKRLGFERARVWGRMSGSGRRSPTGGAPIANPVSGSMDANLTPGREGSQTRSLDIQVFDLIPWGYPLWIEVPHAS